MVEVRAETGTEALKQKLKATVRTSALARHGILGKAFRVSGIAKMETPEKTGNESNSTVTE